MLTALQCVRGFQTKPQVWARICKSMGETHVLHRVRGHCLRLHIAACTAMMTPVSTVSNCCMTRIKTCLAKAASGKLNPQRLYKSHS